MNIKKISIILIIFATLVFLVFAFLNNKKNSSNQVSTKTEVENINDNSPINETSDTEILNNEESSSDTSNSAVLSNNNLASSINSFINSQPSTNVAWSEIKGVSGDKMSLNEFAQTTGVVINQPLYKLLDPKEFDLFACPATNGKKNIGIVLTAKIFQNYNGDLYMDEKRFMHDWEKTMVHDLRSILMPDVSFSTEQLSQALIFKDGKYRFAEAKLPNGANVSINYTIVDDFVAIANSLECLDFAKNELFDTSN